MKKLVLLFLMVVMLPVAALADGVQPQTVSKLDLICPSASSLIKHPKTRTWSASGAGNWKSYSMSLATSINRFIGAQWSGVKVGQLVCLYNSLPSGAFPIQLYFGSLVKQPTPHPLAENSAVVNSWVATKKTNYLNCYSATRTMCAFEPVRKAKQESTEAVLEGFKKDDGSDQ